MAKESSECPPEMMDSEDHLFLLYTSGSTGKPKGLAHSTAGFLTYASLTQKVGANYQSENICRCKNMLRQDATSICSTAGCVRLPTWRHFRLRGGHRVDHGPLVRRLRPPRQRRHDGPLREHAHLPRPGEVLGDRAEAENKPG